MRADPSSSTRTPTTGSRWRLGRFELRVVAAIAVVAFVPLAAALLLGRGVLDEAYRVGVNRRVGDALESGLEVHRAYLDALRVDAERTADAIAYDIRLIDAIEGGEPDQIRERLVRALERFDNVASIEVEIVPEALSILRPDVPGSARRLELERTYQGHTIRVVVAADGELFHRYREAGELVEVYRHLRSSSSYVTESYLAVYIGFLVAVVFAALSFGVYVSRRLAHRITELADATTRVGQGDLTVEVPATLDDEVTDLTVAFNAMVRDIRVSRDRIEYLQRVGAWQEMARRLAHEIKNPLTPIQLSVQELHRAYRGDDARYQRILEDSRAIVEEEIATLRRLVSEFSEFARLPVPELDAADLNAFVSEAVRTLDPNRMVERESEGELELQLDIASHTLPVRIDAMMLRRCLDNLVRNAAQALMETGGPRGRIVVATLREGRFARLEVRDSGPGIAPAKRDQVFDPYFTTKREGTGLGLAIVKKVILEHGGTIACEQAVEGGAKFSIRLPLDLAGGGASGGQASNGPASGGPVSGGPVSGGPVSGGPVMGANS